MLKDRLKSLTSTNYVKSIFALVGGNALAQLITMGVMPILTRLYTPHDFTVLASVVSIASIISVAASLRYDIAIPLARDDREKNTLLSLALLLATAVAVLYLAIAFVIKTTWISSLFKNDIVLILSFATVCSMAYFNAWLSTAIKERKFGTIAKTKLSQSILAAGIQISFGLLALKEYGLIIGYISNYGFGALLLALKSSASPWKANRQDLKDTAKTYSSYPKFSTFEAFFNAASIQLPILLIAYAQIGPDAGFLTLSMQVLQAPIALIGTAVGQSYFAHATEKLKSGTLYTFTISTTKTLFKIACLPAVILFFTAPYLFKLFFGEEWVRSGELIQWMCPWFIIQFVTSPVSMALHVIHQQKTAMYLQACGVIIRVGFTLTTLLSFKHFTAEIYALSGFIFYSIYYVVIIKKLKSSSLQNTKIIE